LKHRASFAAGPRPPTQLIEKKQVPAIYLFGLGLALSAAAAIWLSAAAASTPLGSAGSPWSSPTLWFVLALPIASALGAFRLAAGRRSAGPPADAAAPGPRDELLAALVRRLQPQLTELQRCLASLDVAAPAAPPTELLGALRQSGAALDATLAAIVEAESLAASVWPAQARDFELPVVLEAALAQVAAQASQRGVQLGYLVAARVPATLHGDAVQLRQCLVALLRHRLAMAGPGELCLLAELGQSPSGAAELLLHLDGSAMPSGVAPQPREPEELALRAAQSTLARLGGSLRWANSEGSRACAQLRLPLALGTARGGANLPDLSRRRLLLAASPGLLQIQLERELRALGAAPLAVSDWPSLRERLHAAHAASDRVDVVLVAVPLPGLPDGFDPAALRQRPELGAPCVVVVARPTSIERTTEPPQLGLRLPLRRAALHKALLDAMAHETPSDAETIQRTTALLQAVAAQDAAHRGRILLADDEAVNRRAAHTLLAGAGYQIETARDGREACEMAATNRYDLILMDVEMPRRNGYDATRAIRAAEGGGRRTPILAMTARAMEFDVAACLDAGMDGYVSKPARGPALLAAVESWIGTPPRIAAAESAPAQEPPALAPGALAELRGYGGDGGDAIVLELANLFFQGASEHVRAMREALTTRDRQRFERAAHTLKGSSGTLGARQLEAQCRLLEEEARHGRLPHDAAALDRLDELVERVREELCREFGILSDALNPRAENSV
jgi:CheY-like chemotaxis protein/HPt (histidine-containing phosphotransfer) domain-containing protein